MMCQIYLCFKENFMKEPALQHNCGLFFFFFGYIDVVKMVNKLVIKTATVGLFLEVFIKFLQEINSELLFVFLFSIMAHLDQ